MLKVENQDGNSDFLEELPASVYYGKSAAFVVLRCIKATCIVSGTTLRKLVAFASNRNGGGD